ERRSPPEPRGEPPGSYGRRQASPRAPRPSRAHPRWHRWARPPRERDSQPTNRQTVSTHAHLTGLSRYVRAWRGIRLRRPPGDSRRGNPCPSTSIAPSRWGRGSQPSVVVPAVMFGLVPHGVAAGIIVGLSPERALVVAVGVVLVEHGMGRTAVV